MTVPPHAYADEEELSALQPGDILQYDFRSGKKNPLPETFRVAQWNIERGVQLPGIIATLQACQADIILLQELDIDCRRSAYVNVPRALAEALQMQLIFVCEFEELDSVARDGINVVGPRSSKTGASDYALPERLAKRTDKLRHFHGNAILSRCATLTDPKAIKHTAGLDWEVAGHKFREPRHGYRSALRVTIASCERTVMALPPVYLYCCHLEVFCGALTRVRQLGDCVHDIQEILSEKSYSNIGSSSGASPAFIVAGDMNTMAHGIVRFSGKYATDRMRFLSGGETEACWVQRKILSRGMKSHVTRLYCPLSLHFWPYALTRIYELVFSSSLWWSLVGGLGASDLDRLCNTRACLYDPGDKYTSITLDHPDYYGLVRGKLDWLLLSNLTPQPLHLDIAKLVSRGSITSPETIAAVAAASADDIAPKSGYVEFNDTYVDSDHKGLLMTVQQHVGQPHEVYPPYGTTYTRSAYAVGCFVVSRAVPLALLGWLLHSRSRGLSGR